MTASTHDLLVVSRIVVHCEWLMAKNRISDEGAELATRAIIADTRAHFSFGLPGERLNDNASEQALDAQLDQVGVEIGRV